MTARDWPNKLGYDVGSANVWKLQDCFAVHTPTRCMRVPYSVTTDPVKAAELCKRHGLLKTELEKLEYETAQARYMASAVILESNPVRSGR